jgi:hypothetical protein
MIFEIEIEARIYVSIETGGEDAARRLARDHVCNDWLLRHRSGAAKDAGHFAIKGLSGEVTGTRPFGGNPNIQGEEEEDESC